MTASAKIAERQLASPMDLYQPGKKGRKGTGKGNGWGVGGLDNAKEGRSTKMERQES